MKYAKLINNNISYAPRKIRHNGRWYFNASEEIMIAEGYKHIDTVNEPTYEDGYYWVPTYMETETTIWIMWEKKPIEIEE